MFKWLRNRIELLKNDKQLALIMLLHIVLIGLHVYEWQVGDIELLINCDAIYLLENWGTSKGARLERKIAEVLKMQIMTD